MFKPLSIVVCLAAVVYALAFSLFAVHVANEGAAQCNEACARVTETFNDQCHISMTQREIAIAQEYANHLAILLDLEANRAHELDEKLIEATDAYFGLLHHYQSERAMSQMQMQVSQQYVNQLICYIEENKLPVPSPDPNQWDAPGIQLQPTDNPQQTDPFQGP